MSDESPTEAKPGDKWGPYHFCSDGWWRLNTTLIQETIMSDETKPFPQLRRVELERLKSEKFIDPENLEAEIGRLAKELADQ